MHTGLKFFSIFAAAVSFSLPFRVSADEMDAVKLLSGMSSAMQNLNYEGTFVHIQNGSTELMHILHARTEEGEQERMKSLNGEASEVIRNNSQVTGILAGSNNVTVNKSIPRGLSEPLSSKAIDTSMYNVALRGTERVAGIMSDVVDVSPVDEYRYGYRFWVDQNTGMMLRSLVVNADNATLEELMFTDIKYLDAVDEQRFEVDASVDTGLRVDSSKAATEQKGDNIDENVDKVEFDSLPKGYTKRSESYRMMAVQKDNPVSHLVVSDGISTVSVYVEYIDRENHEVSALGATRIGAVNAFGLSLPTALVTVVGEAPSIAVESIARATRLSD